MAAARGAARSGAELNGTARERHRGIAAGGDPISGGLPGDVFLRGASDGAQQAGGASNMGVVHRVCSGGDSAARQFLPVDLIPLLRGILSLFA